MNSLAKVFSNFKEFYGEINGATLTGAIDVIVVEQPDGTFHCSPFHVRFGKLGVLRSREKVVDIEINGEPVDIHMKLGDSGEAFFVEECPEEELPENLATSPIPTGFYSSSFDNGIIDDQTTDNKNASDVLSLPLPLPRRNSIDFSKETPKDDSVPNFENQVSDYSHRRHTDNTLERRNLSVKLKEYTTQRLRQEWAEHEEIFNFDVIEKEKEDWSNSTQTEESKAINKDSNISTVTPIIEVKEKMNDAVQKPTNGEKEITTKTVANIPNNNDVVENTNSNTNPNSIKEDQKAKKKRRKKSQMKKKNTQRKSSSSSSLGSNAPQEITTSPQGLIAEGDGDSISISNYSNLSNKSNSSSNDEAATKNAENIKNVVDNITDTILAEVENAVPSLQNAITTTPTATPATTSSITPPTRIPDLDIHFFSDTEVTSSAGNTSGNSVRGVGRPSTPIQSDSELEISLREKDADVELMTNSASWKWGELPTPDLNEQKDGGANQTAQAQRNSMLSGMFNFMRKTNKIRKQANEGGVYLSDLDAQVMDPEMLALYFPTATLNKENTSALNSSIVGGGVVNGGGDDDRESGNGTSLPHSPSSMEGQKSLDSDYEDGKQQDGKQLDFVAMSLCGLNEKNELSDEEFERSIIKYSDVCNNPSLFSSPNLVVRLNGKYYSWAAACPIVMTIITFQKPLTNNAIEQLMLNNKIDEVTAQGGAVKTELDGNATTAANAAGQSKRSWWYWRRNQNQNTNQNNGMKIDGDQTAVGTQTSRPISPDISDNTLTKTDSAINPENTSAMLENLDDLSQNSSKGELHINRSDYKIISIDIGDGKSERFKKSLRLSSEAIKKLNLKDGMNEIEFSVTTAYQGTTRCKCYLFRWKHSDKVVISDIDGTITRSDVLGHILPMVGKDWAQIGVAQLFSKIEQNGYKLLYLSARAIGQSRATREYLRSIRQGDVKLPDGPLLLNPTSLISAFHREVIERKPEQFKIACLSDIRDLFPDKDPFYAGYGNRINDVWAYRAVGIPIMRIFTINTKGELKHELTQTFQSSYCSMAYIVDQLFPPIRADEGAIEFSNFNFWRDPIPEVDFEIENSIISGNNTNTNNNNNNSNINNTTTSANNSINAENLDLSKNSSLTTISVA